MQIVTALQEPIREHPSLTLVAPPGLGAVCSRAIHPRTVRTNIV